MTSTKARRDYLEQLARSTLEKFSEIVSGAKAALEQPITVGVTDLAAINTFNSPEVLLTRVRDRREGAAELDRLAREPAIARVVVSNSGKRTKTFFIGSSGNRVGDFGRF
jgi:hypothetical protein